MNGEINGRKSAINGRKSAFPVTTSVPSLNGLTKREEIASKIMAGMAAGGIVGPTTQIVARMAVKWADALLEELALD